MGRDVPEKPCAADATVGRAVKKLGAAMSGHRDLAVRPYSIKIKGPPYQDAEFLAIVVGDDEEGAEVVAFHSAFTLEEVLRGVEVRIRNGSLKWRPNTPYQP